MKRPIAALAAVALSVVFAPAGLAQSSGAHTEHDMKTSGAQKSPAQTHQASGTVTKVDEASSKVTISHGPVQSLKWPAMTMNFVVKDKALLGKLSSGKKIEFEFVQQGRDYVIVSAK
jgi:Cu(I)/Ag(I) efflux system periplasmic protein CusF